MDVDGDAFVESGNQAALYAALAKAQGAFPEIPKNREVEIPTKSGGKFRFRYADLQAILSAVRKPLSENGLAIVQAVDSESSGRLLLTTMLVHKDGGCLRSSVPLPQVADLDPKAVGALITYYRRYAVGAMLGVSADDDLDEDGQPALDTSTAALVLEMSAKADQGVAAYQRYWINELTPEQRRARKALHEAMKKRAEQADAARQQQDAA